MPSARTLLFPSLLAALFLSLVLVALLVVLLSHQCAITADQAAVAPPSSVEVRPTIPTYPGAFRSLAGCGGESRSRPPAPRAAHPCGPSNG